MLKNQRRQNVMPRAGYDVVDSSHAKKRRKASREVSNEECTLDQVKRGDAVNLCRDLERNYSAARAHLRQFKLNVIGIGPKVNINLDGSEPAAAAGKWFNGVWSKDCDSRGDMPLAEVCANILTAKKREGDVLVVFDDFDRADGRLMFFESDQLVNVRKSEWENNAPAFCREDGKAMCHDQGVVYDKRGRTIAYVATSKHGEVECKFEDTTVFPRGTARLLCEPWRLNQRRGVAEMLTGAAHYLDSYEMLSSELQSAKLASKMAGKVTRVDGEEDVLLENAIDPEALVSTTTGSGSETVSTAVPDQNYERFEALCGGLVEYIQPGENFELLDTKRPNVAMKDFLDFVTGGAGAAMGLAKVYSTLQASSSYTAFRGEMLLSWAQFLWDQKWLERRFIDWVVPKAVNWATSRRMLMALPLGWEANLSVIWPAMPEVDRQREYNAGRDALKAGLEDYSSLLGPDWKVRLKALAEQVAYARELKLPIDILETKAGAPAAKEEPAAGGSDDDDDDSTQAGEGGSRDAASAPSPADAPHRPAGLLSRLIGKLTHKETAP